MSFINFLIIIQILSSILIIIIVLMQNGKGIDLGSYPSSNSIFGAAGASTFLFNTTKWLTVIFFSTTIALCYFMYQKNNTNISIMQQNEVNATLIPSIDSSTD
ncbi:hypothetical protein CKSOR_00487 [Candidatus Kinetoplastibacterium sorsogonicusi]|uniref:Protein-export membrane protein SecG n=1 Tax=Candidatus Kinetoplastidibacterium kentomonadis TaxID=1576550 RepID=A0A3Q8ETV0_9PROT|nr:preprotein translocase subunit SecG [Candidatus Kinetoplastibacterium sorsogonicusi]AWD32598.1 hypothetical protein CKSOR_00487 [Candidatus Kinetoplastibacterium sorsogonicusi]